MKVLVLLAHPDKGSFNHAIAHACVEQLKADGHEPVLQDLYAEGFDPLLGKDEATRGATIDEAIDRQSRELIEYDGVIVIHPNWWGMPPAILVGWVDRIVRAGIAYRFVEGDNGEGVPVGRMKAKTAIVFNTSNTEEKREQEVFGDPLETIWDNCIFRFCGVKRVERKVFRIIVTSTLEQRKAWLEEAKSLVRASYSRAEN
jgi:putative NADPH-quinone reductase